MIDGVIGTIKFLSTLSLRRATDIRQRRGRSRGHFYPRSPCGERLSKQAAKSQAAPYFYPRSPCGERQAVLQQAQQEADISIHALLAESDVSWEGGIDRVEIISIHALLAESDNLLLRRFLSMSLFLSTLSLRRATSTQCRL